MVQKYAPLTRSFFGLHLLIFWPISIKLYQNKIAQDSKLHPIRRDPKELETSPFFTNVQPITNMKYVLLYRSLKCCREFIYSADPGTGSDSSLQHQGMAAPTSCWSIPKPQQTTVVQDQNEGWLCKNALQDVGQRQLAARGSGW